MNGRIAAIEFGRIGGWLLEFGAAFVVADACEIADSVFREAHGGKR